MKAIFIIPPSFFAVFSNREKIRRRSFNHPVNRSTLVRINHQSTAALLADSPLNQ